MTVYVDDMHRYPMGRFGRMKMSHMIADTDAELHAMAARIGVARKWFQGDHYDIALSKRERALDLGAISITWRMCGMMDSVRRRRGFLPSPAHAEQLWRQAIDTDALMYMPKGD